MLSGSVGSRPLCSTCAVPVLNARSHSPLAPSCVQPSISKRVTSCSRTVSLSASSLKAKAVRQPSGSPSRTSQTTRTSLLPHTRRLSDRDAGETSRSATSNHSKLSSLSFGAAILCGAAGLSLLCPGAAEAIALSIHEEPANALSIPTWAIHVSSLVEWLVAMGLVWTYADVTGNPKWKGLVWAMVPLHTSGICACTYHFFYNSEDLEVLVALQAFLTCVGNCTLWWAAYRIHQSTLDGPEAGAGARGGPEAEAPAPALAETSGESLLYGVEDLGGALKADSDAVFLAKVALLSVGGAVGIKYGSLLIDAPFEADLGVALGIIFIPTGLNALKWASRSLGSAQS